MHAVDARHLVEREAFGHVKAQGVAFVRIEGADRVADRVTERPRVPGADVFELRVVGCLRHAEQRFGVIGRRWLELLVTPHVDGGPHDHGAEEAHERAAPRVVENPRWRAGVTDEELFADPLTDLVDGGTIEAEARQRADELCGVAALELGERGGASRAAGDHQRRLAEVRRRHVLLDAERRHLRGGNAEGWKAEAFERVHELGFVHRGHIDSVDPPPKRVDPRNVGAKDSPRVAMDCGARRGTSGTRNWVALASHGPAQFCVRIADSPHYTIAVGCPDENVLALLADGALPTDVRADHARHLDECAACRETVGSLVRLRHDPALAHTVASEPPPPGSAGRTATPATVHSLLPGDVVGRYQLERILGEGGLGVVWAARHVLTRKPVALKFTKFTDPDLTKRFLREARVGGVLRHPAVVEVHDIFESSPNGPLVMVMDLLVGESLDQLLARRGRITVPEALFVLRPVLSALAAAHALGIVHRDIKPANIFLESAHDGTGAVSGRLLDFGLARLTATEGAAAATSVLTRDKAFMGTPHYMAPEQLYGESDIDARADVWAVGVVLYECLSGKKPFEGGSVGQIMRSVSGRPLSPLAEVVPDVAPDVAAAVSECLERDRAKRPFDVTLLLGVADRWLGVV